MPKFASEKDVIKYLEVLVKLSGYDTHIDVSCGAVEGYGPHDYERVQPIWVSINTSNSVVKPCANHIKTYLEYGWQPFYNEDEE